MIINLTLASLQEPYTAKLIAIRANLYQNQNRSYGANNCIVLYFLIIFIRHYRLHQIYH